MKRVYFVIVALMVVSCVVEVETSSTNTEPVIFEVEIEEDVLALNHVDVDAIFYNSYSGSRFLGISNNLEIEIPVNLNVDFDLPDNSYGYYSNIEKVNILNERYDLLKGSITKFLNSQNFERNDTIYSIQGFNKQTSGDYVLFDKQTFNFIELEEGFDVNEFFYIPLQIIDDKLYYLKNVPGASLDEIKYINLNNLSLSPQLFYSTEYITRFVFNSEMDLFYTATSSSSNRYVDYGTQNVMQVTGIDDPLKLHFVGVDGKFYAQGFFPSLEQPANGIYRIDVNGESVNATELFSFNDDLYPGISYLGNADIVIPNVSRNNNLVISTNTGIGTLYIYEFDPTLGTINPINLVLNSPSSVDYFEDEFFMLLDYENQGELKLKKINLSNFSIEINNNVGTFGNGVLLDKTNGSIYYLALENDITKFVEIKSDNTTETFEFSGEIYGWFSVIN